MTIAEAINEINQSIFVLESEKKCVKRQCDESCKRDCGSCDLVLSDDVILDGYRMAIDVLRRYSSIMMGVSSVCEED